MTDSLATVGRRSAQGLAGAGVSGVATIATIIIAAQHLGTERSGQFFVGVSLFAIVQGIGSLGVDTGLQYWLPTADVSSRRHMVRLALSVVAALGVLATIVLSLANRSISDLLSTGSSSDSAADVVKAASLLVLAGPLGEAVLGVLRGADRVVVALILDRFVRPILQVALMIGVAFAGGGPVGMVVAWAAPFGIVTLIGIAAITRLPRHSGGEPVATSAFVAYTWPRAIARGAQALVQRLDVLLLAGAVGLKEAAIYGAASRCMIAGVFVATAVQQMVQPQLRKAVLAGDPAEVRSLYGASTTWTVLVTWPVYLAMAAFAPLVMRAFGDGFERGATPLTILCLTMLVASGCGLVDVVLLMLGRSWASTINTLIALGLNVGLNLALDRRYGMIGAAIAWAAAILATNLIPLAQVARHGIHPWGPPLRNAVTTGCATVGIPLLVIRLARGAEWNTVFPAIIVVAGLYALVVMRRRKVLMLDRLTSGMRGRQPRPSVLPRPAQVGSE